MSYIKKGYAYGIEAIALLAQRHEAQNIHYVIVGRGVGAHADLVAKRQMGDVVSLIEELPPEEVRQCYSSADVFFSPSIIEGLSLVSIEAISSALPLVVTDVPGNIDIVKETNAGLVATSGDVKSMAQQLGEFLDPVARDKYSAIARTGSKIYDWSAIARQYVQVYEQAVELC